MDQTTPTPSCLDFIHWFKDQVGWKVKSLDLERKHLSLISKDNHVVEISHIFGLREKTWEVLLPSDCCDTYITTSELKEIASISDDSEIHEVISDIV